MKKSTYIKWILTVLVTIYLLFIGYISYNNSQSDRFGDEVAHMVGGSYVLKGKVLYKDLQFNHLPLNYYMSSLVEHTTQPSNLFLYISKQRLAIFGYGAAWDLLYILAFGPISLLFILFFEIIKFPYAGHKLLGETLATYPLVFITSIFIQSLFFEKQISRWKLILTSISSFMAGFSLLPLWVLLIPMNLIIWWKSKDKKNTFLYLGVPLLLLIGVLFLFVSPLDILQETFTYNVQFFLPAAERFRPSIWFVLTFPFFALTPPFTGMKVVSAILVIQFLTSGYLFYRKKTCFSGYYY